jgi:hypothetical protein
MTGSSGFLRLSALVIAAVLSACGTYTPDKDPFTSDAPTSGNSSRQGGYEAAIVDHVGCEIAQGLQEVSDRLHLPWLDEWGTTVTQTITVEDQTGLSPGISAIAPFQNGLLAFPASSGGNVVLAQSFSFNLGGTASANGLRTETIQYTFPNKTLKAYSRSCPESRHGIMVDGNLKIREFIYDKALVAGSNNIQISGYNPLAWQFIPFNTFTEEITFVASYGASVTPTWHLARFSANTSANLLVSQRTNTNDLIITLGPIKCPPPPTAPQFNISYSQLLDYVEHGKVHDVSIKGAEISGRLTGGQKFHSYAPNDPTLIPRLYNKGVPITAQPSSEQKAQTQECPKSPSGNIKRDYKVFGA